MRLIRRQLRLTPANILDSLSTAVLCLDRDLRVFYVNTAAEALFGQSAKQMMDRFPAQLDELEPRYERLAEALEDSAPYIERGMNLMRSGEKVSADCAVTIMGEGRNRGLMLEMTSDDRRQRISQDGMRQAQHLFSRQVIRGIAHEVKNPLGGIRGAAQLLEQEVGADAAGGCAGIIIREVDRLQALVDRMLGPQQIPKKSELNIHEVTEYIYQLMQVEVTGGVVIERDYDPSVPPVFADREHLIQAILNLVRNAVDVLGEDGTVTLRSRVVSKYTIAGVPHRLVLRLDVEDDGPGVAPELREQIFYPMVTGRAEGTGLGLPIAQELVRAQGGLIECDSEPGETIFSIYLPLGSPTEQDLEAGEAALESEAGEPLQ